MSRRNGLSLENDESSIYCVICRSNIKNFCCFICKRRVCENCLDDNSKYCLFCTNRDNSNNVAIRVPTKVGIDNYIIVKHKNKYCCFM